MVSAADRTTTPETATRIARFFTKAGVHPYHETADRVFRARATSAVAQMTAEKIKFGSERNGLELCR